MCKEQNRHQGSYERGARSYGLVDREWTFLFTHFTRNRNKFSAPENAQVSEGLDREIPYFFHKLAEDRKWRMCGN